MFSARRTCVVIIACFLFTSVSSADWLDKIKEAGEKVKDKTLDIKDTVILGTEIKKNVDAINRVFYEDSYSPSSAEIYQLQTQLNRLGYNAGAADGQLGERSRESIRQYQRDSGYAVNGNLSYELVQQVVSASGSTNQRPASSPNLSKNEWREYQRMLNGLGYNVGVADGIPGRKTRSAILQFQSDYGLVADGTDRNGLSLIQNQVYGSSASSQASIQQSTVNQNTGVTSQNSQQVNQQAAYVLGTNDEELTRATQNALSLNLIARHPELLDNTENLDKWFRMEGRTVESEYLRPEALAAFKQELLQRPVPRMDDFEIRHDASMRRGGFIREQGRFILSAHSLGQTINLPQFGRVYLRTGVKLPTIDADPLLTGLGASAFGIPMSLQDAISFEKNQMTGRSKDYLRLMLVVKMSVDDIVLEPADRRQSDSWRNGKIEGRLSSVKAYLRSKERRTDKLGALVHEWPVEQVDPAYNRLASNSNDAPIETPGDVRSVAERFGMQVVAGHIDVASGQSAAFAAAIALAKQPELLDDLSTAYTVSRALLPRGEFRKLLGENSGSVYDINRLDSIAQQRIHERIKGEYKALLLSRTVPTDLPLMISHATQFGGYDSTLGVFPIKLSDRRGYSGKHAFTASGEVRLTANTGDTWLPQEIRLSGDEAIALRDQMFSGRNTRSSVAARHALLGKSTDARVVRSTGDRNGVKLSVELLFDVEKQILLSDNHNEFSYALEVDQTKQEEFKQLADAVSVPTASGISFIESVKQFDRVDEFKESYILSSRAVRSADEFDRAERIAEMEAYFDSKVSDTPLWVTGEVVLGEYDLDTGHFAIKNFKLADSRQTDPQGSSVGFSHKITGNYTAAVSKDLAINVVRPKQSRTFNLRARLVPVSAVVDRRYPDRRDHDAIAIMHRIAELYVIASERNTSRQSWQLLSHMEFEESANADSVIPQKDTESEPMAPIKLQWVDGSMLDQDILLLMAAKNSQPLSDESWDWLLRNRWAYDNGVDSSLAVTFFDPGAAPLDDGSVQVHRERFKAWVNALQFPEIENVKLLTTVGHGRANDRCDVLSNETKFNGQNLTFKNQYPDNQQLSAARNSMSALRQGDFVIEKPAVYGLPTLAATRCHQKARASRSSRQENDTLPLITLTVDSVPQTRLSGVRFAEIEASVDQIVFDSEGVLEGQIANIDVSLEFKQVNYLNGRSINTADVHRVITAEDLKPTSPQGKDPRLESSDIVDIKLGMPLPEAIALVEAHLADATLLQARRDFTTNPQPYQHADVWVSPDNNEYIALFYEGETEAAMVLGITRGIRLPGKEFDRTTALKMLRSKYGAEELVLADKNLNLLWGKHVTSWPEKVGIANTSKGSGKGACGMRWSARGTPTKMKDAQGAAVDLRKLFNARATGSYLNWPEAQRYSSAEPGDCDFYLEAFHDDTSDPQVFIGLFDIEAYDEMFQKIKDTPATSEQTVSSDDTEEVEVKF